MMRPFLTWLNRAWEEVLQDPSTVPGNTWDEKVLHLITPTLPPGWSVYVKGRWDLTYGRKFCVVFRPEASPAPTDSEISFY